MTAPFFKHVLYPPISRTLSNPGMSKFLGGRVLTVNLCIFASTNPLTSAAPR
jgi:hypothetical protein